MYRPGAFDVDDLATLFDLIDHAAFGHLVTVGPDGFDATGLPLIVDRDRVPSGRLRGHVARANPQWRTIDGSSTLVIFQRADGYVSPSWYPSKAEHGKVVPTWNYELMHVHGTVRVHDDAEWVREVVTDLTDRHEAARTHREGGTAWMVTDAPAGYIDSQLRAIVGIEVEITSIEGKRKLSQNRPEADRAGVEDAMARSSRRGDQEIAASMRTSGE